MPLSLPEHLNADRTVPVIVRAAELPWMPSPQSGVERRFLERSGGEVADATSIVRYAPGSAFPAHVHGGGEEFLVLEGVFSDEYGDFAAGTYVRNPPGSRHAPFTRDGCVIFVKLRQMREDEREATVRLPHAFSTVSANLHGLTRTLLYRRNDAEVVAIERLDAGIVWQSRQCPGGEEIFVLEGTLLHGATTCPPLTWLRMPGPIGATLSAPDGCRYWVKRGHLPEPDSCTTPPLNPTALKEAP